MTRNLKSWCTKVTTLMIAVFGVLLFFWTVEPSLTSWWLEALGGLGFVLALVIHGVFSGSNEKFQKKH